jgi:haloalkane dehalogenase
MSNSVTNAPAQPARRIDEHRSSLSYFGSHGERIAYLDIGPREGKPIVLLHGMPTSSWLYRNIAPALAREGLRVIAPDMLGFGASDKPSSHASYGFATQAERLRALMSQLGIQRWTQVVHDLGGPWTWELADRAPQCLQGLVVMNTTAYLDGFRPPAMMKLAASPMGPFLSFMMRNRITGPSRIGGLFRQMTLHPENITSDIVDGYWRSLSEGTTHAFLAFAKGFPWWFAQFDRYQAALRRLDIPAATIWGRHDKVLDVEKIPAQFARDLKIPGNRQHRLDAGHFLQEDHPSEVAEILAAFMKDI